MRSWLQLRENGLRIRLLTSGLWMTMADPRPVETGVSSDPDRYRHPMAVFRTTFPVAASAETIWEVLVDFERWSEWNPSVPSISGDARLGRAASRREIVAGRCLVTTPQRRRASARPMRAGDGAPTFLLGHGARSDRHDLRLAAGLRHVAAEERHVLGRLGILGVVREDEDGSLPAATVGAGRRVAVPAVAAAEHAHRSSRGTPRSDPVDWWRPPPSSPSRGRGPATNPSSDIEKCISTLPPAVCRVVSFMSCSFSSGSHDVRELMSRAWFGKRSCPEGPIRACRTGPIRPEVGMGEALRLSG